MAHDDLLLYKRITLKYQFILQIKNIECWRHMTRLHYNLLVNGSASSYMCHQLNFYYTYNTVANYYNNNINKLTGFHRDADVQTILNYNRLIMKVVLFIYFGLYYIIHQ